jgi:DNA-directed RNA polymerase specialized sigma24 family protein
LENQSDRLGVYNAVHLFSLEWMDTPVAPERIDGELLSHYLASRDEAAFTALVERHGRMVREVCRRVLDHEQDAEDASQCVFLLLVQKAAFIHKWESIQSWLHGAALRVARNLQKSKRRRQFHESNIALAQLADEVEFQELQALLDTEVQGLPESLSQKGGFVV